MSNKDPESFEEVVKKAWEKVKNENDSMESADKIYRFEEGEINVQDKREEIIYNHLFALVERAILSCTGNDIDEICQLVEAYDMLLAIGITKDWIDENE